MSLDELRRTAERRSRRSRAGARRGRQGVPRRRPRLDGVSVEIPSGDQVAVVGPSGSGKTTMLTILGTLERPTSGEVQRRRPRRRRGHRTASSPGCARTEIGFVFQTFHLQDSMTALDNVATGMLYTGRARTRRAGGGARGARARRPRPPARPTGRRSCRAASASGSRSPARSPSDRRSSSPTSRPGTSTRSPAPRSCSLLHELAADGATLVLITHDENIAATFPRRVQMRDGEIVADERA